MSRVDDALRRAAGEPIAEHPAASQVLEPWPEPDASVEGAVRASRSRHTSDEDRGRHGPQQEDELQRMCAIQGRFVGKVVIGRAAPTVFVEQYRRLAATLHDLQLDRDLHSLTVTSSLPREGKTLTAINLALTLSTSYQRRVLLVDTDLRKPSLHEAFGIRSERGLSEVLESAQYESVVYRASSLLSVLPAGKRHANPLASLSSERMQMLLDEARSRFDWIVLDTPPVGILPDAGLIAGRTDATLFVIAAGMTPYPVVARAMEELGRNRILGAILNRLDPQNIPSTEYYGEYGRERASSPRARHESHAIAD